MSSLGVHDYWIFLATGIVLNVTPGPDTLYIVGRSLAYGRSVGVKSAMGVCTGGLLHAIAAAFGLSAILATSLTAFAVVKVAGAAYLIYLGARMLLGGASAAVVAAAQPASQPWTAYRQGILTSITNPKVAVFFMAFLPQFIEPAARHRAIALLLLGASFNITGLVWCLVLALGAARLRSVVSPSADRVNVARRLVGAIYVALGIRLATVTHDA